MPPAFVLRRGESDMQEWPPLRPFRLPGQGHVRFAGEPISFARVTGNARADHILPGGRAAAVAWDDMIQIEIVPVENVAAILAGVLVAFEDVVTRKLYFLLRQSIKEEQDDDAR